MISKRPRSGARTPYVIAEAGVNHNGSVALAMELVDAAAAADADAVKFQSFRAQRLISRRAPKAAYQIRNTGAEESQLDMIRALELSPRAHRDLMKRAKSRGIEFLSTPFDLESVDLLQRLGVRRFKVGSGDVTNGPLLLKVARTGRPMILSTGMSALADIAQALDTLAFGYLNRRDPGSFSEVLGYADTDRGRAVLERNVILLQCTTDYPAKFSDVNLRVLATLRDRFGVPAGLSDHTQGIAIPIAAAALGAAVIEKHLTTDRKLPGPDHRASLEPAEFAELVAGVRAAVSALGTPAKVPGKAELVNRPIARRSLVTLLPVKRGETFTRHNLGSKRPGTGISPMHYWDYVGSRATRDYDADELVE